MTLAHHPLVANSLAQEPNLRAYLRLGPAPQLADVNIAEEPAKRIIAHVEAVRWTRPKSIDLQLFAKEIWVIRHDYPVWKKIEKKSHGRERMSQLEQISRKLHEVHTCILLEQFWIKSVWTDSYESLERFIESISQFSSEIKRTTEKAKSNRFRQYAHVPLDGFNSTKILTLTLADIGSRHLGIEPRFSRPADGRNIITGPFARFTEAALRELRIHLTVEAVAKAVQRIRQAQKPPANGTGGT